MQKKRTFPLRLTDEELATLRRRAKASGYSMQKFARYMALDGSLPKSRKQHEPGKFKPTSLTP